MIRTNNQIGFINSWPIVTHASLAVTSFSGNLFKYLFLNNKKENFHRNVSSPIQLYVSQYISSSHMNLPDPDKKIDL